MKLTTSSGAPSSTWASTGDGVGVRRFNSSGSQDDEAADIAIDANGNVTVVGTRTASGDKDVVAISYEPDGDTRYSVSYDSTGGSTDDVARAVDYVRFQAVDE